MTSLTWRWAPMTNAWPQRWVFGDPAGNNVRIMRKTDADPWKVRSPRWVVDQYIPAEMPIDKVKAVAIAMWRLG